MRYLGAAVAVFLVRLVLALVIGWLAHRPRASWLHVALVANTAIGASMLLLVTQFIRDGFTLFSVYVAGLLLWLAYAAVTGGNMGFLAITANRAR